MCMEQMMTLQREVLWEVLSNVRLIWNVQCVLEGYFGIKKFSDSISHNKWKELLLIGRKFIQSNSQDKGSISRTDRFLTSKDWENRFKGVAHFALSRHCQITIVSHHAVY